MARNKTASGSLIEIVDAAHVSRMKSAVYNPREPNDRFALGVKVHAEAELFTLHYRRYGGSLDRRGGKAALGSPAAG